MSTYFSGVSSYAADLQQVITRALNIAAMPLTMAQNQLQSMNDQESALNSLDTRFSAVETAVTRLESALGASSYAAVSSDSTLVTASVGTGALRGSYTVAVSSVGSYSTALSDPSLPAVADPYAESIGSSASYTLTVNGQDFDITPSGGGLMDLAQTINASSAGVQASLVNTGSSSAPNYRLVLSSEKLGPDTIELKEGTTNLLGSVTPGTKASYTVNGLATPVESDSRTVTLAPGLSLNLLQPTGSQPITISVSRDSTQLATAVSDFVSAYNDALDAVGQQVGVNAGALSGDSIVRELAQALRKVTQFTAGSGSVTALSQMGLTLGSDGHYSFDSAQFNSHSVDALQSFLGSSGSGGFLKNAADVLKGLEDTSSGALKLAIKQADEAISNQNDRIDTLRQRINDMQTDLTQRMAAADALIASLESKKSYFTNLFTAMTNQNKNGN